MVYANKCKPPVEHFVFCDFRKQPNNRKLIIYIKINNIIQQIVYMFYTLLSCHQLDQYSNPMSLPWSRRGYDSPILDAYSK